MIETSVFYGVKCDRCHEMHENSNDMSFFYDYSEALEDATDNYWIEKDGKHYCPSCYEGSEESGTLKIKPSYPKEVFKLSNFLSSYVSRGGVSIKEDESCFEIACCQNSKASPDKAISDMIDFILKGFLWSYKVKDIKNCSNSKLIIKINK